MPLFRKTQQEEDIELTRGVGRSSMPTTDDYDKADEEDRKNRSETHVSGAKYKGFLAEMFKRPGIAFIVIFLCGIFIMLLYWLSQF